MKDKRLLIIFLTVFIDLVGFGIIIPLNPYLAEAFGATPLQVGLLMSVYSLMQFIASPVWGQLSDRHGRRPIILISLLGAALAHAGFAMSTSFTGLVIMRGLAGLFGGNISTAMAYIADITTEQNRSKGMGLVGAAFGLGFMCGPVIGGVFANTGRVFGDGPPFNESFPALIAALICFVNFLMAYRYLPESLTSRGTAQRESRFKRISRALTTPVLRGAIALVFFNTFAMALIEAPLFLYVQNQFQWSLRQASFGFAYIGVIMVLTQGYLIRKFMPKFGERKVLAAGLALSALGWSLIGLSHTVGYLAVAVTFLALGNGMANPALNGSVSLLSGRDVQGNNLGVSQSLSSVARILGPPLGGALYQHYGVHSPFTSAGLIGALALVWVLICGRQLPEGGKAH